MKAKIKLEDIIYGIWDLVEILGFLALICGLIISFLCKSLIGIGLLFLSVAMGLMLMAFDRIEKRKYEKAAAPQRSNVIDRETICRVMAKVRKKEEKRKKPHGAGTPGGKGMMR